MAAFGIYAGLSAGVVSATPALKRLAEMTQTDITIIIGVVSYIASVITTSFIVGVKWGKITTDVDHMKTDLAEIKGMFKLTLKE